MAPATRRIRHVPRLRAAGHHDLHSKSSGLPIAPLTQQPAGSDERRVENKVLEHFETLSARGVIQMPCPRTQLDSGRSWTGLAAEGGSR
jgi:hypothetical protein